MDRSTPAIPGRFRDAITLHMVRCLAQSPAAGTSQILLILGSPGTGKTFQTTQTLLDAGVTLGHFGADEVEDPSANRPVRVLVELLDRIAGSTERGHPAALIVDDVDLVLGRFLNTQYTHNLQRVNAELMKVAERTASSPTGAKRVPIFMIGNDPSSLHRPLLRAGRTRLFRWEPQGDELAQMVHGLFPRLNDREVANLLRRYKGEAIAFFAVVRESLLENYFRSLLETIPTPDLLRQLASQQGAGHTEVTYSLSDLTSVGDAVANERRSLAAVGGGKRM